MKGRTRALLGRRRRRGGGVGLSDLVHDPVAKHLDNVVERIDHRDILRRDHLVESVLEWNPIPPHASHVHLDDVTALLEQEMEHGDGAVAVELGLGRLPVQDVLVVEAEDVRMETTDIATRLLGDRTSLRILSEHHVRDASDHTHEENASLGHDRLLSGCKRSRFLRKKTVARKDESVKPKPGFLDQRLLATQSQKRGFNH